MTVLEVTAELTVELIQSTASDRSVVAAARVSTQGTESLHDWSSETSTGLINYLMKNRHGTPFEHNSFTFFVKAPIFVFREFHRHRIGWSYNEESGRYKQLDPCFYVPNLDRPMLQRGKPGRYEYFLGERKEQQAVIDAIKEANLECYAAYEKMLEAGVAKEVARMCLPVNIFSSMYATCNARSLMAFLSLRQKRTKREPQYDFADGSLTWTGEAFFPSAPMQEINIVADRLEEHFAAAMPLTHAAFAENGYVAP